MSRDLCHIHFPATWFLKIRRPLILFIVFCFSSRLFCSTVLLTMFTDEINHSFVGSQSGQDNTMFFSKLFSNCLKFINIRELNTNRECFNEIMLNRSSNFIILIQSIFDKVKLGHIRLCSVPSIGQNKLYVQYVIMCPAFFKVWLSSDLKVFSTIECEE
ncbi:hypothetical protein BCV71DRAFT_236079 [Rhizopus microsporus]|uniref:Uncharacterized protein n=1 Tax=Rhizopus microsporus TaxID=58291 RepID=A0A1X0RYR5_RHIZD|nr:hypothetical protein BCV71DRAFT_236079 [Rhizopus microsporus]